MLRILFFAFAVHGSIAIRRDSSVLVLDGTGAATSIKHMEEIGAKVEAAVIDEEMEEYDMQEFEQNATAKSCEKIRDQMCQALVQRIKFARDPICKAFIGPGHVCIMDVSGNISTETTKKEKTMPKEEMGYETAEEFLGDHPFEDHGSTISWVEVETKYTNSKWANLVQKWSEGSRPFFTEHARTDGSYKGKDLVTVRVWDKDLTDFGLQQLKKWAKHSA